MSVTLQPHQERAIQTAIEAGRFRSIEEFIDSAIRTLVAPAAVMALPAALGPAMRQVDGLWVHQGQAEPGAEWDRVVNDVREERLASVLKG